ncbi:MAG: BtaA family protein [Taibaiella sp.]|nr:BtaA family protein [Taibaiella sp.]
MKVKKQLDKKVAFDFIRYANCWEDADILLKGLHPAKGSSILSIGSAGDNSFSLLSTQPRACGSCRPEPRSALPDRAEKSMYSDIRSGHKRLVSWDFRNRPTGWHCLMRYFLFFLKMHRSSG